MGPTGALTALCALCAAAFQKVEASECGPGESMVAAVPNDGREFVKYTCSDTMSCVSSRVTRD